MKLRSTIIFLILISFIGCSEKDIPELEINEIEIGALIPLTGAYKNQGDEVLAALNLAVEDINTLFEDDHKNTRIKLVYSDTKTDPAIAKSLMQTYIAQDIRITIGPLTSGEINLLKGDINSSDNILISPSSTLTSLSVANDNIYRFVTDDAKMIEASVAVMWEQGIRKIALFYRDNIWGQSFSPIIEQEFEARGGTYLGAVSYIGLRGSELREYLDELSLIINNSLTKIDPSTVAVQMISYDAGSFLLDLASTDTTLSKVKWFGCDGYVNTDELFLFENGLQFAGDVGFTSPIYGIPVSVETQTLLNRIQAITNSTPSSYALLAYDALITAAKTLDLTTEDATLAELKEAFATTLSNYTGITGNIELNTAGDRDNGSYFYWTVVADGSSYKWEHTATYTDGIITSIQ